MYRANDLLVAAGALAWAVSAVAHAGGLINGLTNPFQSWLAFLEAVEFIPWLLGGGDLGLFVRSYPNPETTAVVAGLAGLAGWLLLGAAFIREGERRALGLTLLFVPALALFAVGLRTLPGSDREAAVRMAKAGVFWGVVLLAPVDLLVGDAGPALALAVVAAWLVLAGEAAHRLLYGRWLRRADLERLAPIRPARPAE